MPTWVVTAPTTEPVTIAEAKKQLRLEVADDDAQVLAMIGAARDWVEKYTGRGLVTQTLEVVFSSFAEGLRERTRGDGSSDSYLELPRGPLASVTTVKYLDSNGAEQTLANTEYIVDTVSVPGRVRLAYGKSWPTTREQWDGVRIRYVVGSAAASVPLAIRQACLLLVSQMYEHRTPEVTGTIISEVQFAVDALLTPYRILMP